MLFQGSIRENLDPFVEYSDERVWAALERCALRAVVDALPGKLEYPVQEGGANLSLGQRQLLCLGRALLKQSRVLCIDEATASVDAATDRLVQDTIAREFPGATVLTVAHRIATVMGADLILVLDQGRVVEVGSPSELLANSESMFARLAASSATTKEQVDVLKIY